MTKPIGFYAEDLELIDQIMSELEASQKIHKYDKTHEKYFQSRLSALQSLWFRVEEMVDKSL